MHKPAILALGITTSLLIWWLLRTPPLTAHEAQLVGAWNQDVNWSQGLVRLSQSDKADHHEELATLVDSLSRTHWVHYAISLNDDRSVSFHQSFNSLRFGGSSQVGRWHLDGDTVVIEAWPIAAFPNMNSKREPWIKRAYRQLRAKISPPPPKPIGDTFEIRMVVRLIHDGLVMYREGDHDQRFLYTYGLRRPRDLSASEGFVETSPDADETMVWLREIVAQQQPSQKTDRVNVSDWPEW